MPLPLLLGFTGCLYGVPVSISGPPDQPVLSVGSRSTVQGVATLDSLEIHDLQAAREARASVHDDSAVHTMQEVHRRSLVWGFDRDPTCGSAGARRIQYGHLPEGYGERASPQPLVEGRVYGVSVSGCGFVGGAYFRIVGGKVLYVEGTGDEPRRRIEAMR